MEEKQFRQVYRCGKYSSEAEMRITCELVSEESGPAPGQKDVRVSGEKPRTLCRGIRGAPTCGAEAGMWVDFG